MNVASAPSAADADDRDPNEGYISNGDAGWVPVPKGMTRAVATLNLPEGVDIHDVALQIECYFEGADSTVWRTVDDFQADWSDGVA